MSFPAVTRMATLSREECLERLASVGVGRLGVSIDALPVVLPVNFAVAGGNVIIRTVEGTKLDAAVSGTVVAFEADQYDPDGGWGWSVLVRGRGCEITDPRELAEADRLPLRAWAFKNGSANRFLKIETTILTGRRFSAGTPSG